jgi:DNA-directed RNA polymerase-5 subunit 1
VKENSQLTLMMAGTQVKAQPMNEEFPLKHPSQLSGNPALGLPLQFGRCDSCGATDLSKCEGTSLYYEINLFLRRIKCL